jgi:nicotinamide-nucleotide amidase
MTSPFPPQVQQAAAALLDAARTRKMTVSSAESCTGGLIGASITEIPGSSDVYDRGYITYSYASKTDLLGIKPETLTTHGAVSAEVAAEMAAGVLKASGADVTVAVTGIAGPGGATPGKPVGLVYIAIASKKNGIRTVKNNFDGDRNSVRMQTVEKALNEALAEIKA